MRLDLREIAENARRADTTDLLDRVTVYRDTMEPAAVDLFEAELSRRGVDRAAIAAHAVASRESAVIRPDGTVVRCEFCDRPAVRTAVGWHRIGRLVPVFRRTFAYCMEHDPAPPVPPNPPADN